MKTLYVGLIWGGAGLVVGTGAGYLIGVNLVKKTAADILNKEIDANRRHYETLMEKREAQLREDWHMQPPLEDEGDPPAPDITDYDAMRARKFLEEMTRGAALVDPASVEEEPVEAVVRITDVVATEADAGEVIATSFDELVTLREQRDTNGPYFISLAEYTDNDEGYDKINVIYYEEDDTLSDEDGGHIPDGEVDRIVGSQHFGMFGTDSGDKDVIYVRNDNTSTDFCITRDPGSWAVKIGGLSREEAGLGPEKVRPGRMRPGDE